MTVSERLTMNCKLHPEGTMKRGSRSVLFFVLTFVAMFVTSRLLAKDTLQIDKAYVGTTDSWRDVTMFLQDQIQNDALSISIAQPFKEIGGDPAPGRVKDLIIDYHLNSKPYRLCIKEEFPVAFRITIPSPDAESPGANPEVTAVLENVSSSPALHSQQLRHYAAFVYIAGGVSLVALVCAVLALVQVRQLKKVVRRGIEN